MEQHHFLVSRSARYYREPGAASDVLWYVLHGYGQLAAHFLQECWPLCAAGPVIAPEGLSRFYLRGGRGEVGASWMTREDREYEIGDQVAYLDALHADVCARHGSPRRVHVLGFSQGCATASRWVVRGTTGVHALVLWGGTLPPEIDLVAERPRFQGLRLVLVGGRGDAAVPAAAHEEQERRLAAAGLDAERRLFDGGHELHEETLRSLAAGVA